MPQKLLLQEVKVISIQKTIGSFYSYYQYSYAWFKSSYLIALMRLLLLLVFYLFGQVWITWINVWFCDPSMWRRWYLLRSTFNNLVIFFTQKYNVLAMQSMISIGNSKYHQNTALISFWKQWQIVIFLTFRNQKHSSVGCIHASCGVSH